MDISHKKVKHPELPVDCAARFDGNIRTLAELQPFLDLMIALGKAHKFAHMCNELMAGAQRAQMWHLDLPIQATQDSICWQERHTRTMPVLTTFMGSDVSSNGMLPLCATRCF